MCPLQQGSLSLGWAGTGEQRGWWPPDAWGRLSRTWLGHALVRGPASGALQMITREVHESALHPLSQVFVLGGFFWPMHIHKCLYS